MKSEVQISNGAANVIKFLAIEVILAFLIEPAVSEINRIRAQRLAVSGRRVRIRTTLLRRDFSGPAVGGKKGVVWKLFVFIGLLAALLATEFGFDYDVKTFPLGSTIQLTGLSDNVTEIPKNALRDDSLSKKLFNLVKCSSLDGNIRYEARLRPDGQCFSGNSSGVSFPEPCTLNPTEARDTSCVRTDKGIVRQKSKEIPELQEVDAAKATYVLLNGGNLEYKGKRDESGKHIRYCSSISPSGSSVTHICLEYLDKSGDSIISGYVMPDVHADYANVEFFNSPVVRIGADTFTEPGCPGCGLRMSLMLDFVAANLVIGQHFNAIRPSFDDYGRVVAMLAMGLPAETFRAIDDQEVQEIGFLIIDWNLVLPLAIITIIALLVRVPSFMIRKVVNVPLDYSSAMYSAYDREVGGGDCNSKNSKPTYDVGLVETCKQGELYLSLNAEDTVPYKGEEIRGTNKCRDLMCEKCSGPLDGPRGVVESQSGVPADSKGEVESS